MVLGKSLPSGPAGLPILGSLLSLDRRPELTLQEWAQKFGPLYSVWLGEQLHIVVSDPQIAKDLLVAQGNTFSSRKDTFVKSGIVFAGRGISAVPTGENWTKNHRLISPYFSIEALKGYLPGLEIEAVDMLRDLYIRSEGGKIPVNPLPHVTRTSLNNMLTIIFGLRTDSIDHPLVGYWLKLAQEFTTVTGPISNPVDFVPFLRRFPTLSGVNRAKQLHQSLVNIGGALVDDIDRRIKAGEDVPDCLARHLLKLKEEENLDSQDIVLLCCELMIASVEKTAAVMSGFVAQIGEYADVQARAQAELDRVVGRDRLPGLELEKDLPYIGAIVKETERLNNPRPLAIPHTSTQDVTYRGHFIPKDTVIVLNTHALTHDAARYANPDKLEPERHLKDQPTNVEPGYSVFGYGPRACPGKTLAQQEIFLVVACLLWAFDVQKYQGAIIEAHDELSTGSFAPVRVKLSPRHNRVSAVLGYRA
ncbi:uncharacterized protein PHACADRAFT_265393 [Phanerochaete carnosa HHB-10118-sp]|uniref:Cytochrome P450 n=1 Tax=Phanerochaete carnosa (strain HHB-10118-sp) TaxID=650164 RepID=K5UJK1_PHACS|nr:uncharacterized protein PHACADRAFT_265393 [Phanerochaete carnosa HHB-10118-sp]EKM49741.1 hypothetical protein PHACADRAFT_265393 [Phanerochaete carnosa HHB-10118-sp]